MFMRNAPTYLGSRIVLLLVAFSFGIALLVESAHTGHRGSLLLSVGWLLLGVSWFLQPAILSKKLFTTPFLQPGTRVAPGIGPRSLRVALLVGAFGCIAAGIAMHIFVGT